MSERAAPFSTPYLPDDGFRSGLSGAIVLSLSALAAATTLVWALLQASRGGEPSESLVAIASAALLGVLASLLAIPGVRAMALQTFAQCLRMKIAVAFMVILAAAMAALPSTAVGDGTLAGAIQATLSYGVSVIAFLLSLVTVLVSASVVAHDIQRRQIFLTAAKPLPRWQYVTGRWLGVVMFGGLLLALSMGTVYALSQHLRAATHPPDQPEKAVTGEDRRKVETEVFASRGKVFAEPPDIEGNVQMRLAAKKNESGYQEALEMYKMQTGGDEARAERMVANDIRKQVMGEFFSVGSGGGKIWRFSGIEVASQRFDFYGEVMDANLPPGFAQVRIDPRWAPRLLYEAPVTLDEVEGRVLRTGEDFVIIDFYSLENFQRLLPAALIGRTVHVVADPVVQLSYKASATGELPGSLQCIWTMHNPRTGWTQQLPRSDAVDRRNTITVSSRTVDAQGEMEALFINETATGVRFEPQNVYVLFAQGSFEWTFLRATLLMLLQIAFLAALGVLAGSFLSFPVAILVCLTLLGVSLVRPFLVSATQLSSLFAPGVDFFSRLAYLMMQTVTILLPDFGSTWPSDTLVDGLRISWSDLGQTATLTVALRAMIALALCCLIFRKRELARVQV